MGSINDFSRHVEVRPVAQCMHVDAKLESCVPSCQCFPNPSKSLVDLTNVALDAVIDHPRLSHPDADTEARESLRKSGKDVFVYAAHDE